MTDPCCSPGDPAWAEIDCAACPYRPTTPGPRRLGEPQCMGWTQAGRRCKLAGRDRGEGWIGCGNHPRRQLPADLVVDPEVVRAAVDELCKIRERIGRAAAGLEPVHLVVRAVDNVILALYGEVEIPEDYGDAT